MKKALSVVCSIVSIAVILITLIFFKPSGNKTAISPNSTVITLWHIDGFEGGVGSRASFLRRVGNSFSNKNSGVYILVSSHTVESASKLIGEGTLPDLISYGSYFLDVSKYAAIVSGFDFVLDGGEGYKKRVAVSWCKGSYFYIEKSKTGQNTILNSEKVRLGVGESECLGGGETTDTNENFTSNNSEERLIISEGESNSAVVCLAVENYLKGGKYYIDSSSVYAPQTAYTNFILSNNCKMIGTQRDVVRLSNRGVEFTATPISSYNDLFQYISITTKNANNLNKCKEFIKFLLSEEIQKKLVEIKMLSSVNSNLYQSGAYALAEKTTPKFVAYSMLTKNDLESFRSLALKNNGIGYGQEIIKGLKQL